MTLSHSKLKTDIFWLSHEIAVTCPYNQTTNTGLEYKPYCTDNYTILFHSFKTLIMKHIILPTKIFLVSFPLENIKM